MSSKSTLLFLIIFYLGFAISASAELITFEYAQLDRKVGVGSLSGIIDGIEFSGTMPPATVTQNDQSGLPVPAGMIGYMDGASTGQPGNPFGVHIGWTGVLTLTGTKQISPTVVELYELDLPLVISADGTPDADWRYSVDLTDDGGNGNDAFGTGFRIAGWLGDATQGHRQSAAAFGDFLQGSVDSVSVVGTHGSVGEHGRGDALGIAISLRNGEFGVGSGPIYVDNLFWQGGFTVDPANIRLVPEPSGLGLTLLALICLAGIGVKRRWLLRSA